MPDPTSPRRELPTDAILVLGAQRSGTTWLGKIFDSHPSVVFRNEPDRLHRAPPAVTGAALRAVVAGWIHQRDLRGSGKRPFFRKSWQSAPAFVLRSALCAVLDAGRRLPVVGGRIGLMPLPDLGCIDGIRGETRAVLKSITWCDGAGDFARTLPDSRTVLILRHPCAQVASVMRGARQRQFEYSSAGTDMPYDERQAIAFARRFGVDEGAFQALPDAAKYAWSWRAFNETASAALADQPNARSLRYEDLCARPDAEARALFAFAGLAWDAQTEAFLARSSSGAGPDGYYGVFRNSAAAAEGWRTNMSRADQAAVRSVVGASPLARLWPDLS